jgi:PAS domain S-box-containing protein
MIVKARLVWKLGAVVAAILTAAITLSGYVFSLLCEHHCLESARAALRFNSESIVNGIGQQMMSRNNQGVEKLIGEISRNSTLYRDIRLVSHHSGEIVASRFRRDGRRLGLEDRDCAVCHEKSELRGADGEIVDTVIALPEGERVLSVVAPVINEPGCRNAACHVHQAGPPILGLLSAEYSLGEVDGMAAHRRIQIAVTVLASVVLGIVALWLMFARLLEKPIRGLIAGTQRIAANQLDFRFSEKRHDEIGVLEKSFNAMTARVQAHRDELRSAMEYLGGIVENSADVIITGTPEGFIETFNRGAEQILGYDRVEMIGKRIESLYVDPSERHRIAALLEETGNVKNYETRLLAKDGQVRNVLLTLSYLRDREGNPIGTIGISKDVTQEKRLAQELVQSQKFAAIGQAVTGIQHAIKNLLNALRGGAYLVRNGMAKDNRQRIQEGWAMVEEGIERIGSLSNHMLNYAKEWKLELQEVDLNELVAKLCESNRQTAADRGVTLRREVADGLPAVRCDPKLIHMAATDILLNAIDACTWKEYRGGECPEVVLKNGLTQDGGSFVIEVRDNGCGMNEQIRRNIFTPFFSTKETRGTGLGLALTARIVKLHRGAVTVESEPDRGATFRIQLPIDGPQDGKEVGDDQASSRS